MVLVVRNRAYASATILALALGLGVTMAVATVVVVFSAPPISSSDRVVLVYEGDQCEHVRQPIYPKFQEWRRRNTVRRAAAIVRPRSRRQRALDAVAAAAVGDNFFICARRGASWIDARDQHGTMLPSRVISAPFARRPLEPTRHRSIARSSEPTTRTGSPHPSSSA
jgi:hypothetical protein